MEHLPSYHEATARPDWLGLVAPYVDTLDYPSLCLVSHRFRDVFAPRLWGNLIRSARETGLDPGDDLSWWFWFIFTKLDTISEKTRNLVRVLDLRHFAREPYGFASDQNERTLKRSVKYALESLDNATSLLLDGHEDLDPNMITGYDRKAKDPQINRREELLRLFLLSIADCHYELRRDFFTTPSLQELVYLDISGIPGSIWVLFDKTLLPHLRVLKVRKKEIDQDTFLGLVGTYGRRLWSLDIGENRITDGVVDFLAAKCFPLVRLQSPEHFQVEGRLAADDKITVEYGPFVHIEESEWSAHFNHPERFFADSPMYTPQTVDASHEHQASRSKGIAPVRRDTAEAAVAALSEDLMVAENFRASRGLTHLHLSDNFISAVGIERLIRLSMGHIEQFSCDSMLLLPPSRSGVPIWPAHTKLHGIVGVSHIFRPVFSSNLQVLRVHHSLVTHIPTLDAFGLDDLCRIHVSENDVRERVDAAYPQAFIPDMNPRLTSLTLTRIPRRSSGPLIDRLLAFLKLLSVQERRIQDVSQAMASSSRRGPGMLKGLRHLRLEFEPDVMEHILSSTLDDTHLGAPVEADNEDIGFSFFGNEWTSETAAEAGARSEVVNVLHSNANADADTNDNQHASESDRDDDEYMIYHPTRNEADDLKVWIGKESSPLVIRDYRRLVVAHKIQDCAGPATPAQVLAGAPAKSYIFHTAWRMAAVKLDSFSNTPSRAEVAGMRDVVAALKAYRMEGRQQSGALRQDAAHPIRLGEPHFFWTGSLEVVTS